MKGYEIVIGLEVHVELATKTKIFCACSTKFGGKPNTHTCPVCTGMPGALPVLNKQVVEYAIAVGIATNCTITRNCRFDRKNYFYPDNPQNYQISQLYYPICKDGYVDIELKNGESKPIRIHEIHMEEDAGKLIHDDEGNYSLVDYNRSGVPLIEIVSEPDMSSADEVIAYLEKLRLIIEYLGASDCKLNEGSMRADVNLSVRRIGDVKLGIRTEMKNLNSFKAITRAIENETNRQIEIIESGEEVVQETRRWDDVKGCSYSIRSKEDAKDYRYFPEPDLVPISISDAWLDEIRKCQPEFRDERISRYINDFGIPEYDAKIITLYKNMSDLFDKVVEKGAVAKEASNWLMGETMRVCKDRNLDPNDITLTPDSFSKFLELISKGIINKTVAKDVFEAIFDGKIDPVVYVEENGLSMDEDEEGLKEIIKDLIMKNPKVVEDYKNGNKKAAGVIVGQTMKEKKGKANPQTINKIILEILG